MRLYGFWRSTATWRVRIALGHKRLPFEYVPVHLRQGGGEQNTEAFARVNPMRQVPVLEIDVGRARRRVAQSMAILELLEELHPEPALLPRDPYLRARARQIAETIVAGIQPLQNTSVQLYLQNELRVDERAWCRHWVTRGLSALEQSVAETAGAFAVGDAVSFADVCLVPQLHFARRFGVDPADYPTLAAIERRCGALAAFAEAHADRQPDAEPG